LINAGNFSEFGLLKFPVGLEKLAWLKALNASSRNCNDRLVSEPKGMFFEI